MLDSREKLAEAIEDEEKGLKVCRNHPENVAYDEPKCPACEMLREFNRTSKRKIRP